MFDGVRRSAAIVAVLAVFVLTLLIVRTLFSFLAVMVGLTGFALPFVSFAVGLVAALLVARAAVARLRARPAAVPVVRPQTASEDGELWPY